jgi:single-stranded-DNA-specific exonuclease RecJ
MPVQEGGWAYAPIYNYRSLLSPQGGRKRTLKIPNINHVQKQKGWRFYPENKEKAFIMAQRLNIPVVVAQVLLNRGINTVEEGKEFLEPDPARLYSPFLMKDMDSAVEIINKFRGQGEKIAIYGDYDVDGITATALLYSLLQKLGGDVLYYLPNRLTEGYGLHKGALEYLKKQGATLLITVDCGISNDAELHYARELGMEVIITDHHQPLENLPDVAAIINPLRTDCSYPFKDLCGVGIAFKLGQALLSRANSGNVNVMDYLDLVALGTVADVVPLTGENRIMVAKGLAAMANKMRPGLKALCTIAGLGNKALTAEDIAFIVAPRLNAAGRLGDASLSLSLLLEVDEKVAQKKAQKLHEKNIQRQKLENEIMAEACKMVEKYPEIVMENYFLLLAREKWHPGVLGIVASRLAEKYNLPVILIALEGSQGKGSGRTRGNFNLIAALQQCSHLLEAYGGHQAAVGLTINAEQIPSLRERLNILAQKFFRDQCPAPSYYIDGKLNPEEITPELVRILETLEPFGFGNPPPLFYGEGWVLAQKWEVGKGGQHLRFTLNKNNHHFSGICFNGKSKLPPVSIFREVDFLFTVSFDRWRGRNALQLEVHYFSYSDEHVGNNLFIINRRNLKEKKAYIRELLRAGEKVLVFVNTARRLQQLKNVFSGFKNIYFSHQGKLPENNHLLGLQHLVLHDLPLRENIFIDLVESLLSNQLETSLLKIHLIYGEEDFADNIKLLRATLPSFSSMEHIYFSLEEIAAGKSIALEEVYKRLPGMLPFATTRHLLKQSMAILEKARYLGNNNNKLFLSTGEKTNYCSLLSDVGKLDVFRQEKERWEKTLFWQQYLLMAKGEEIVKRFTN